MISSSPNQTIKLGQKISKQLKGGEIICLYGNLGAGKTTLIKGIARGLGIKKIITSPTFVLMKVYPIPNPQFAIRNFIHMDCYRVNTASEIENIGATEYFNDLASIVVIEWPEKIKDILPKKTIKIKIKNLNKNQRQIKFEGNG